MVIGETHNASLLCHSEPLKGLQYSFQLSLLLLDEEEELPLALTRDSALLLLLLLLLLLATEGAPPLEPALSSPLTEAAVDMLMMPGFFDF